MRLELRMKYLETIYQRYHRASKRSKGRILDELCKVCKYSRKYAIWKLNRLREEEGPKVHKARHRGKKYDHEVLSIVEVVWEVANYRYNPPKGEGKTNSQPEKLSVTEKETLEDIAQVFGITVYVRTHKGGKLIALGNG